MLCARKNRFECAYGCCTIGITKAKYRRIIRKRETVAWKKEIW